MFVYRFTGLVVDLHDLTGCVGYVDKQKENGDANLQCVRFRLQDQPLQWILKRIDLYTEKITLYWVIRNKPEILNYCMYHVMGYILMDYLIKVLRILSF